MKRNDSRWRNAALAVEFWFVSILVGASLFVGVWSAIGGVFD
jgi:hypothetical protein